MDLFRATRAYESWLHTQVPVFEGDLRLKHRRMAEDHFSFFRATFYRWVPAWFEICADLARAPSVLAIGDLHVENFGTWRDKEGRLIWGINDFDEAAPMPYTLDLVRLATGAMLAKKQGHVALKASEACEAILHSYVDTLSKEGEPFVLEEEHPGLRTLALSAERDPEKFWGKLTAFETIRAPAHVRKLLADDMPVPGLKTRIVHRVSGLGSLGQARYVALAGWAGGNVAREAKAARPSAYCWALGRPATKNYYADIITHAVRCPDPFTRPYDRWLLRRLGPHCSRIELTLLPEKRDESRLLAAMGRETANIHLGSRAARAALLRHVKGLKKDWLLEAARRMAKQVKADWKAWAERYGR